MYYIFARRAAGDAKKEGFIKRFINYYTEFRILVIYYQKLLFYNDIKLHLLRATFVADRSLRGT